MTQLYHRSVFKLLMMVLALFAVTNAKGQQADSIRQRRIKSTSQKLMVEENKSVQIVGIIDNYKAHVKIVMSETGLAENAKRAKIDQLIVTKNNQLRALLTPGQFNKLVPTTERNATPSRRNSADSISKKRYIAYLQKSLAIDENKSKQVIAIIEGYQKAAQGVMASGNISGQLKRTQIDHLIAVKNTSLSAVLNAQQFDKLTQGQGRLMDANAAIVQQVNAKKADSIRNAFAKKARLMLADTLLSQQVKDTRLADMVKDRNDKLLKCWGIGIQTNISGTLKKPSQHK
jgi:hypothetical protein